MLNIPGYADSLIASDAVGFEIKEAGTNKWIKVYNHTASAISNGAIKQLAFSVSSGALLPIPIAPITATLAIVGVIDNSLFGQASIAAYSWGWMKIQGQVDALCNGTSDIATGVGLEILTTGTAFTVAGQADSAAVLPECSAIALEAYTDSSDALKSVYLIGRPCTVAGS
jgi:hypothetical protein